MNAIGKFRNKNNFKTSCVKTVKYELRFGHFAITKVNIEKFSLTYFFNALSNLVGYAACTRTGSALDNFFHGFLCFPCSSAFRQLLLVSALQVLEPTTQYLYGKNANLTIQTTDITKYVID